MAGSVLPGDRGRDQLILGASPERVGNGWHLPIFHLRTQRHRAERPWVLSCEMGLFWEPAPSEGHASWAILLLKHCRLSLS